MRFGTSVGSPGASRANQFIAETFNGVEIHSNSVKPRLNGYHFVHGGTVVLECVRSGEKKLLCYNIQRHPIQLCAFIFVMGRCLQTFGHIV